MKYKILLIDTHIVQPIVPDILLTIGNLTHQIYMENIREKLRERKIKNSDAVKMFSFGGQWSVTTGLLTIYAYLQTHRKEFDEKYAIEYIHMDYLFHKHGTKAWKILSEKAKGTIIAGISCATPNYSNAISIAKTLKKTNPKVITVIGGPHVTFLAKEVLHERVFDLVVRGEGERTFLDIVKHTTNFSQIRGISYKKGKEIIANPDQILLTGEEIPSPQYSLLPKDAKGKFIISISCSRGCPYNCLFCSESRFWGQKIRLRSISSVLHDLMTLKQHFGKTYIHFSDSNFPRNVKYINELIGAIMRAKLDMFFSINLRANEVLLLDKTVLKKLLKAGFVEILLGIESGSDKVLERMQKRERYNDMVQALRKLRKAGFPILKTYWMLGFPGETKETLDESYEKLSELITADLCDYAIIKTFIPYPGTPPYTHATQYGLKINITNWVDFERFSFPPPYSNETVTDYTLFAYLVMMQGLQLTHMARKRGISGTQLHQLFQQGAYHEKK